MDIRTIYRQAALARQRVDKLHAGIRMSYDEVNKLKQHIKHDRYETAYRLALVGTPYSALNAPGFIHDYRHAHSLEQAIRQREADIHHMERQVNQDLQNARTLESLARSAEAGNTYALHQAEELIRAEHLV